MIDKELMKLQKGIEATCVVILNEDCKELDSKFIIKAKSSYNELVNIFKDNILRKEELNYCVIEGIDEILEEEQNIYYHIVKDREINGYKLPNEMIIVLTVKDKNTLKNISKELYDFCVVIF